MPGTARLTEHARARCAEMGISTKVAKQIVRRADITRPSRGRENRDNVRIAVSDAPGLSELAVVYYDVEPPLILTVVFRSYEQYVRRGVTFDPVAADVLDTTEIPWSASPTARTPTQL